MRVFDSRKLLTVGVLLLFTSLVVIGATSKETAVVKDVSFNTNGESLEVRIATSDHAQYTYFELSNPHRLVVDFHGIQNGIGFKEKAIDAGGVERVRTSYFTDKNRKATRIVFDLSENVPYTITDDGDVLVRVVFGDPTGKTPSTRVPEIMRAPLALTAGPPMLPTAVPSAEKPLPILPRSLALVKTSAQGTAPQALTAPQLPSSLAPMQIPSQQFTGELVTITLKDQDVKDFFLFLSDFTGLNIVLDPSVSGTVTLSANDLPWDQALDIVLKNLQLGAQLQGNVLRIAKNDTLQAEEESRKKLLEAKDLVTETITKTRILNYSKVDLVAATLTKVLTAKGTIIPDGRRNALIITDIPSQFTKIDQTLDFLDAPAQQVLIEGRLLSANKSFSSELGSQLGFVLGNNSQNSVSGAGAVGASPFSRTPAPGVNVGGKNIPLSVNLPAAGTSGLSFLLGTGADIILDEIITAAEARGTAKLISRPKVATQNNQVASISQGTQIPVQTNQNNTVSVQFLTFSLKLNVTPQITDVGTILLTVQIENSQPDFARAVNGIPSVATQTVSTQILVGDGETAVLGGILIDTDSFNLRQVPGFGSIPVIGHLFKNTSTIKSTAELLFFITPRIQAGGNLNMQPPGETKPPGIKQ